MSDLKKFNSLPLNQEILNNLETLNFFEMTPIQEKSLPSILKGTDLIAQAKTGSGKTAAFGLGILANLDTKLHEVQALVLCPTRELAEQVCQEIRRLGRFTNNIKILTLTGGTSEYNQQKSLTHGAHIIVGTPGRIQKLFKKDKVNLDQLKIFVLDEADRMLEMGFIEDIHNIASFLPSERQTILFSATFPPEIQKLSENILKESAEQIKVDAHHNADVIKQLFIGVDDHGKKLSTLPLLLNHYQPESTVIFCKTKQICKDVVTSLQRQNFAALALHGDLDQRERTLMLTKFTNKSCLILVATDVAARGLDIKDLQLVINYDLPDDPEVYIHRIGRTGRAGKEGLALSLFSPNQKFLLKIIEETLSNKIKYQNINDLDQNSKFNRVPPMSTIVVHAGRKDKLRPGDILGALTGEAEIKGQDVGQINIFDTYTYIAITTTQAEQAVSRLTQGKIKNRKFRVEMC